MEAKNNHFLSLESRLKALENFTSDLDVPKLISHNEDAI